MPTFGVRPEKETGPQRATLHLRQGKIQRFQAKQQLPAGVLTYYLFTQKNNIMLSRNYKLQQKQDETNGQATGEAKRFRAQRNREEKNYRTLDEFKEIVDKYFSHK